MATEQISIKALTLWQPYATLKAHNIKIYETRSWETSYRGPMMIHAAKKPTRDTLYEIGDPEVVRQILLALRELGYAPANMPLAACAGYFTEQERLPVGAFVGTGNLIKCHKIDRMFISGLSDRERALGYFAPGRFAWEFKNMSPLPDAIPAKGGQGIWNWDGGRRGNA